jgi:hypothetical protein
LPDVLIAIAAAASLALLVSAGCAGGEKSRKGLFPHEVKLSSKPEGAKLMAWAAGEDQARQLVVVGLTPHTLTIPAPATVILHKKGFQAVAVRLALQHVVEVALEPAEEDAFYDDIWMRRTFQGYRVSFGDDQLRRLAYVSDNMDLPSEISRAVMAGELIHGMTPEQVGAALGKPQAVVTREMGEFVQEKWIYESRELFFERGVLITWKE